MKGLESYDFHNLSFYNVLKEVYGITIQETDEELLIVEAKKDEQEYLDLQEGDQILFEKGKSYLEDSKDPFEYFEMSSIPTFYRFRSVIHQ